MQFSTKYLTDFGSATSGSHVEDVSGTGLAAAS